MHTISGHFPKSDVQSVISALKSAGVPSENIEMQITDDESGYDLAATVDDNLVDAAASIFRAADAENFSDISEKDLGLGDPDFIADPAGVLTRH